MKPERLPTIREVAAEAGVSLSTVSLALRGNPRISEPTRRRVEEAAARLGYRPMPAYAALGSRRKLRGGPEDGVPVAVVPAGFPRQATASAQRFHRQLAARLGRLGYRMDRVDPRELGNDPPRVLEARGYAVVLLDQWPNDHPHLRLDWSAFVVLCRGRISGALPFHTVRVDYTAAARELMRRVLEQGYRRVGIALGRHEPMLEDDRERMAGLLGMYFEKRGRLPRIPPLDFMIQDKGKFLRWLERTQPDIVIGLNDTVWRWLEEASIRLGQPCPAFVSFIQQPRGEVSGMASNIGRMVEALAEQIDHAFRHSLFGAPPFPYETVLPLDWHPGTTFIRNETKSGK